MIVSLGDLQTVHCTVQGSLTVIVLHNALMTIHHLLEEFKGMGKRQKKIHSTRSIIDYADEKIVSFEELEPEERTYCSLLSNLVLGLPLVAAALIASVL